MCDDLVYTIPKSNAFVCVAPSVIVGNSGEVSADVVLISRSVSDTIVIPAEERNEPEVAVPGRPALAFCAIELLRPRLLTVLVLVIVIVRRLFLADSDCNAMSVEERIRFFLTVRVELSDITVFILRGFPAESCKYE